MLTLCILFAYKIYTMGKNPKEILITFAIVLVASVIAQLLVKEVADGGEVKRKLAIGKKD